MIIEVIKSHTRGSTDLGWLKSYFSFSFSSYYNPQKIHFGALRVLNDDVIAPAMGFGMHPHDNMEIITIPISGCLEHKDNMGNTSIIKSGDVQVMSAGSGLFHSEFNPDKLNSTSLLQIWVLPNKKNVTPRYQQITLENKNMINKWLQIVSPNYNDDGAWIYQNAWFFMCELNQNKSICYQTKNSQNGLYIFLIDGTIETNNYLLETKDAITFSNETEVIFNAKENSKILLMEVPIHW